MFSARREILVGVLFFFALALFFALAVMIAGEQLQIGIATTEIQVRFPNVKGVQTGTQVNLNGAPIGKVVEIVADPQAGQVILVLRVRAEIAPGEPFALHTPGYTAQVQSTLFGARSVEITDPGRFDEAGNEIAEVELVGTVLQGQTIPDVFVEFSKIARNVDRTIGHIDETVLEIQAVARKLNDPSAGIAGRLIGDPQFSKKVEGLVDELTESARTFQQTALDISDGLHTITDGNGTIAMLLNDAALKQEVQSMIGSFNRTASAAENAMLDIQEVVAGVRAGEGVLGWLVSDAEGQRAVATLFEALAEGAPALTETLRNTASITRKIDRGQGSLGRLVNDDTLIVRIEALIGNASRSLDDLRETTPIVTFASLIFTAFQ